jgi:hypothetical protein
MIESHIQKEMDAWRNKDMKVIMLMQRQMSMELRPEAEVKPWSDDPEAVAIFVAASEGKRI